MRWFLILLLTFAFVACADSDDDDGATTNETRATAEVDVKATETRSAEQTEVAEVRAGAAQPTETAAGSEPTATEGVEAEPTATERPSSPSATTAPPTATTPAVSADVQLGKWVNKEASYGGAVYTMGEVINQGTGDAGEVEVVVTHYDAAGTVISSGEAFEILPQIPADGKSPFRVMVSNTTLANVVETKIQVQFKNYDPDAFMANFFRTDIEVTQVSWTGDQIAGEVLNAGDEPAEGIQVLVIGYDEAGEIYGVYATYVDLDQVDPGVTAPFSASYLGFGDGSPAKASAFAYGRKVT